MKLTPIVSAVLARSTRYGTSASGNAAELATYVVEKGRPFIVLAE